MTTNYNVADWNVGGATAALSLPLPHPETPSVAQGGIGQKGDIARIGHALKELDAKVAIKSTDGSVRATAANAGDARLVPGDATRPGMLDLYLADGTRVATLGWDNGSGTVGLLSYNNLAYSFNVRPKFNALPIATVSDIDERITNLIGLAPPALDTWAELVAAIQSEQSATAGFVTTLQNKASVTSVEAAATAASNAQTAATNAQTTANSAQTTANAAMPKSGGTFSGPITVGGATGYAITGRGSGASTSGVLGMSADGTKYALIGSNNTWAIDGNGPIRTNGEIRSDSGGFRFPDGSVQTTAGAAAVSGSVKGWVKFNGLTGAIIASGGVVTSVARLAAGDYRVTFTTLGNTNYAPMVTGRGVNGVSNNGFATLSTAEAPTATTVRVIGVNGNNLQVDINEVYVAIIA